jgi:hypothetical protein
MIFVEFTQYIFMSSYKNILSEISDNKNSFEQIL